MLTPCIARLVNHAVVLPIHSFSRGALAFFAVIHNGLLRSLGEINLDAIVGMLDDLDCHVVSLCLTLLRYPTSRASGTFYGQLLNWHTNN